MRVLAEPSTTTTTDATTPVTPASNSHGGLNASSGDAAQRAETPGTAVAEPPSSTATEVAPKGEAGAGEAEAGENDGGVLVAEGERGGSGVAAGGHGGDGGTTNPGATEASVSALKGGGEQGDEAAAAAVAATAAVAEAGVLAEVPYSSGVLVALDPTRPTVFKITVGGGQGEQAGGGSGPPTTVLVLGAIDG